MAGGPERWFHRRAAPVALFSQPPVAAQERGSVAERLDLRRQTAIAEHLAHSRRGAAEGTGRELDGQHCGSFLFGQRLRCAAGSRLAFRLRFVAWANQDHAALAVEVADPQRDPDIESVWRGRRDGVFGVVVGLEPLQPALQAVAGIYAFPRGVEELQELRPGHQLHQ